MAEAKDVYGSVYENLADDKKKEFSDLQEKIQQHITSTPLDKITNSVTGNAAENKVNSMNELISAAFSKRMSKDIMIRYFGGGKNEKTTMFGKLGQMLGDKVLDQVLKQDNSYDNILISQEALVIQKFKGELDALKGSIVLQKEETTPSAPPPSSEVAGNSPHKETNEGYAEKSHYTDEEKKQIDAVIASAKEYEGVKYLYGGTSKSGIDCSGLWSKAFGEQYKDEGRTFGRLTAALFDTKASDIDDEQVEKGDRMFWEDPNGIKKGGKNENGDKIYHIEMALGKRFQKDGKWYVKTYGSSTDKMANGKGGVGYRIREIKDNHHFAKPPYYEKLVAMKQENGNNNTA